VHLALRVLDHEVSVEDRSEPWTRSAIAATTVAPKLIDGTKCPSMTSTWITRGPAASTSSTCDPNRAKSADRIYGATRCSRMCEPGFTY
jgi:hypothetical protein